MIIIIIIIIIIIKKIKTIKTIRICSGRLYFEPETGPTWVKNGELNISRFINAERFIHSEVHYINSVNTLK